ncbi:MAG: TAXI family TRAP transporter solute-binding subunit, partial [Candidatus Tectomicrobia bacterium]|nr:TAXI family TRAP transporter solute-binding subunit [Candidatus Tectomicrobia bacterium]
MRGIAVAVLMAGLAWTGAEAASTKVTIVGAGKGAGAFRMAGAVAEVANKESKTVNITNQETAGFVANARMIANARVEFALSNGVFVDAIQRKLHPFDKDKAATNLRGIGPIGRSWLQIAVLADSGIMKVEDLKGKRFSMGPKGSNSVYMQEIVFKAVGIYDSLRKDYLKWEDAANYMVDGKLDAWGIPNPIPGPALLQAAQSRPIRMLDIPEKALDAFLKISKAYFKTEAGMSVYRGMEGKKIRTIAYDVYILAHDKVPADVVYEVAKHFYDPKNRGFILNVYRPLRDGLDQAQNDKFIGVMKSFGLKLHPGAERYW